MTLYPFMDSGPCDFGLWPRRRRPAADASWIKMKNRMRRKPLAASAMPPVG
jgi:hypothetical protein